jgi:hypothetical protein
MAMAGAYRFVVPLAPVRVVRPRRIPLVENRRMLS